jgi:endogenous inhibitor of DNA gyrase (YacG/DUF329 family)
MLHADMHVREGYEGSKQRSDISLVPFVVKLLTFAVKPFCSQRLNDVDHFLFGKWNKNKDSAQPARLSRKIAPERGDLPTWTSHAS